MNNPLLLFPEPTAGRIAPIGNVEPRVRWFTESTRPEAAAARVVINEWYAAFPDPEGAFAARLRSEVNADHLQAIDELFVHHLLCRRSEDVQYEVGDVGPDFRVLDTAGRRVAGVEVVSLFQQAEWTADEQRHGRLADEVNRRVPATSGYFVDFQIVRADREPAPRHFADFLTRRLAELPPPYELHLPKIVTRSDLPKASYLTDHVTIDVTFLPMKAAAYRNPDPDLRIVGTGAIVGGVVNTAERLRVRLRSKAGGRYDIADAPFVIVVGAHDVMWDDHAALEALYGGESVVFDRADPAAVHAVRRNDGFFGVDATHPEGRHRRVSGIATITRFDFSTTPAAAVSLYENPAAQHALPHDLFDDVTRRFGLMKGGSGLDWL